MVNELETWRAARGMTQQQLADAAGLSTSTIDRAESGDCGRKAARALAQVTGIRPAVLLGLEAPEGDSEDTDPVPQPMSEVATTTTRALARREAALAAFEALTGWTPTVEITVDAEGRVTRLRMEARTRLSPNASARVIRAHMDHLGRCMMEVEAEVDPQGSTLRQRQQTLGAPLPILLHRRKPEGPRHMLKLVAQYAADNPVGAMHPTRLDVLAVAALLLLP